jgi:hypothetical protein
MKNCFCILCNNKKLLKVMLCNIPKSINKMQFYIFTDDRIKDIYEDINKICKTYITNYKIIKASTVNKKFKSIINNEFVLDYTMSMNILMQWYLFKYENVDNILSLDDDIILNEGVKEIFCDAKSKFKVDYLRKAKRNFLNLGREEELLKEFFIIFNMKYDSYIFYNNYVNGGHFLICKKDVDLNQYEKYLFKFFDNKIIYDRWKQRRSHISYQLDEKFITLLAISNNIENNLLKKDVKMFVEKNEKIKDITIINSKTKKIVHICNNSGKKQLYKRMISLGVIKDV